MAEEKRKVGRPTKYRQEHLSVARQVAALGGLDFHIANALEVDMQTVENWRLRYPEFAEACDASEVDKLRAMKRSLYQRGMGYSHMAEKIMTVSVGNGMSQVVREPFMEHYPPDVAAMRLYLINKSNGEFAERQEVEQSGGVTVRVVGGLPGEIGADAEVPRLENDKPEKA